MSDDLFEGIQPNHPPLQPLRDRTGRLKRAPDPAKIAARQAAEQVYQAMVKARDERRATEWKSLEQNLADTSDGTYKGFWFGVLPDNKTVLQHSKQICGTAVAKEQTLLPRQHKLLQGSRFIMSKRGTIMPAMVKPVVILRLDEKQMLMAKLNKWGKDFVVSDPDGSIWNGLARLITASKQERDMSHYDNDWKALLNYLHKLFH